MRDYRFRAFIAYSHADEKFADWLQRELETFTVPGRLVGDETPFGPAPRKLTPIFRDRSDLSAAGDLGAELDAALRDSLFLIVISSPDAAKSPWVNEEIRRFKARYGDSRILAAIVAGAPFAAESGADPAVECFPEPLRRAAGPDGALTDRRAEPLAADFREGQDGPKLGFLKLAAGLLGVPLDTLAQRDARRRADRMKLVIAGLSGVVVALGGLAVEATLARRAAESERNAAQSLIEFMLTDLRERLEPVGRLDALESLGRRALSYYAGQNARGLDADALSLRSRALLLVGEIDTRRGDLPAAQRAYDEAAATTAEQLRRRPNDPQRIYDHAQSVYWTGYIAHLRTDYAAAERNFLEYLRLAEQLMAIDAASPKHRRELGYALNNLGALARDRRDYPEAVERLTAAIEIKRALNDETPGDPKSIASLGQSYSWLAEVARAQGDYATAEAALTSELALYDAPLAADPTNRRFLAPRAVALRALAHIKAAQGEVASGHELLAAFTPRLTRLHTAAPDDVWVAALETRHLTALSEFASQLGRAEEARKSALAALNGARALRARDASVLEWKVDELGALQAMLADITDADAWRSFGADLAALAADVGAAPKPGPRISAGRARLLLARRAAQLGTTDATLEAESAIALIRGADDVLSPSERTALAHALLIAGRTSEAESLAAELASSGYAHPALGALLEDLKAARLTGPLAAAGPGE